MSGVDITGAGAGFQLNRDIYVNNVNEGTYDASKDVKVFLQDGSAVPITPTSSVLVGNDLTITANIPVASGVSLQFPIPSRGISLNTYDTGWRAQNGWFNYTPPAYPAKYAELDTTLGANQWYRLKTALTVNGVSSTNRFVDLSGVQGWAALNNLNAAVLDKLTGLMWSRTNFGLGQYATALTNAFNYSVTINGNVYDDWYMPSFYEFMQFFGTYSPSGAWVDPISGLTIYPFSASFMVSDRTGSAYPTSALYDANSHLYGSYTNGSDQQGQIRVQKVTNLIS
jgi:hypothetical protein